jgi:hypothetical protein
LQHVAHPGVACIEEVERAFGAVEPAISVLAGTEAPERRLERCRDEIERGRVAGLVGAHLVDLRSSEIPLRRPGERHHLEHARIGLQHRAQRHAERGLARRVEALLAPADLDEAPFAEGEPRQAL